jgi:hypothetical protein
MVPAGRCVENAKATSSNLLAGAELTALVHGPDQAGGS